MHLHFFAQFGEKHLVCCGVVKREQQLWGLRIVDKTPAAEKKAPPHSDQEHGGDTL